MRKLNVSIPEYHNGGLIPQNFDDFIAGIQRPGGFWRVATLDKTTGDVLAEQWLENSYTDNGCNAMFHAIANSASYSNSTPGNIIAIDQSCQGTTLSAGISSGGTVTSISVNGATATIPSGTKLVINPGTGNSLTVTTTQSITTSGGTCTVNSVTGPASAISSGAYVRLDYTAVVTADPGSLSAPVSYTSALPSGQFTYTMTTGYGNRTLSLTNNSAYLFSTTGSPAATANSFYTSAWLCSANPVATTSQTYIHVCFDNFLVINSTTVGLVTITEKL